MKCYFCNTELIWGGDNDMDDLEDEYDMETNLSCRNCDAFVLVYRKKEIEGPFNIWKSL